MVLTVKNNISWLQYETGVGFVRFQTRIKIQNQIDSEHSLFFLVKSFLCSYAS